MIVSGISVKSSVLEDTMNLSAAPLLKMSSISSKVQFLVSLKFNKVKCGTYGKVKRTITNAAVIQKCEEYPGPSAVSLKRSDDTHPLRYTWEVLYIGLAADLTKHIPWPEEEREI